MLSALKSIARPIYGPLAQTELGQKIAKGPWRFDRVMRHYFTDHCSVVRPNSADPNLQKLVENGFVVLPAYHPAALIKPVHDRAFEMLEKIRLKQHPAEWRTLDYGEDGIYRLRDIAHHIPEATPILEDKYLRSLIAAYFGPKPFKERSDYVDYKPDQVHDYTSILHMDSPFSQLKIFTLLSDVGPKNAPMVYWGKSQLNKSWRRRFDYLFWVGDDAGSAGMVPPHILRNLRAAGGPDALSEVPITGPAGTVLIADTRGIHRASNLIEGYRLEFVQKFSP